jgi:pimeloyl-ACP methyl ester carboxylesterase
MQSGNIMKNRLTIFSFIILLCGSLSAYAEGEAGIISLRGQGHFYVGIQTSEPASNGSVQVHGQMYVGFQLAAERKHPYPIILVHGGSGQAVSWFSTPDDRDGWRDYFLAAGFDVYWVDRPGYGRSPTNVNYGELRESASTGIISFLAQSEQWPGNANDHLDPSILASLAASPPGPYGGDHLAAKDLSMLLDKIGPAILMTYSAGAVSGWWAADMNPDKVAALIAVEPASSNITSNLRKGLTFVPALSRDFEPVQDEEDCDLQPKNSVSTLVNLQKVPVKIIGAELGLTRSLPCSLKAMRQAGVDVDYLFLPDIGITGNGHLLMAERNNGEIAQALIELMSAIK